MLQALKPIITGKLKKDKEKKEEKEKADKKMQGNACKLETYTKKADQCITATERNSILQAHFFLSFQ